MEGSGRPAEVLDARVVGHGLAEVLVRWKGCTDTWCTWEPVPGAYARPGTGDAREALLSVLPPLPLRLEVDQKTLFSEESWITEVTAESSGAELPLYTHVTASLWSTGAPKPSADFVVGCECGASDGVCAKNCSCAVQTQDGQPAYDASGRLRAAAGGAVTECNERCPCGPKCPARLMQRGRTVRLLLHWMGATGRGWGVLAGAAIDGPGAFVERYLGEVISAEEAARRAVAGRGAYIFDMDYSSEASSAAAGARTSLGTGGARPGMFCIDAGRYGNASRFFNHSCDPNMRVVATFIECSDPRLHGISFVTTRPVRAGEELTFDYWGGRPPLRRPRGALTCRCGASSCRGFVH